MSQLLWQRQAVATLAPGLWLTDCRHTQLHLSSALTRHGRVQLHFLLAETQQVPQPLLWVSLHCKALTALYQEVAPCC